MNLDDQEIFEESFDEISEDVFECYNCNWVGTKVFKQKSNLWDSDEIIFLCPICGCMI